ncbi:MAG: hypothetical protein QG570_436 [Patescibacteria group bacterium]|nr:hypothetical protein [Patescibacteria group bacterium]
MKRLNFSNKNSLSNSSPTFSSSKSISSEKYNYSNKFRLPKFRINVKWLLITLGVFLGLVLVIGLAGYFLVAKPVLAIADDAKKLKDSTYAINAGLENQDLEEIKGGIDNTKKELETFKSNLESNSKLLRKLPRANIYYEDGQNLVVVAEEALSLGELAINIIEPYAGDLGFASGDQEARNIPAQERVIKLMRLMPEFSPKVNEISQRMVKINDELNKIDASNYPTKLPWIVKYAGVDPELNLQEQILDIQAITKEVAQKAPQFEAFFNAVPEFMGLNKPKTYMIVMANNYELRMSGGFNTYIILVTFADGIPDITDSIDTYFIDEGARAGSFGRPVRTVPYHLKNYLYLSGNTFRWYARDATSNNADFPLAADDLVNLHWKNAGGLSAQFDGVISINNDVAVDILRAVGPVMTDKYSIKRDDNTYVTVPVTEFNADNVIYELENIAGGKLAETIGRKEIIKFLATSILTKIYTSEATNLVHIMRVGLDSLSKKDVMLYSYDPVVQKAFEDLGYGGRIASVPEGSDYLHVNRSNYGAGKADWTQPGFVYQTVDKKVEVIDGKKISTVNVTIKNPKRPEWFNIDPCCFYNAYMRIYVPMGSKMISVTTSDGQDAKGAEFVDDKVQKTYIESFTRQPKETDLTITYMYELPDSVNLNDYNLVLQRQSGTTIDEYRISANGKTEDVLLNSDKVISITR